MCCLFYMPKEFSSLPVSKSCRLSEGEAFLTCQKKKACQEASEKAKESPGNHWRYLKFWKWGYEDWEIWEWTQWNWRRMVMSPSVITLVCPQSLWVEKNPRKELKWGWDLRRAWFDPPHMGNWFPGIKCMLVTLLLKPRELFWVLQFIGYSFPPILKYFPSSQN